MGENESIGYEELASQAIASDDRELLLAAIDGVVPGELGLALSRMSPADHTRMLRLLEPKDAGRLLEAFENRYAAQIMEQLRPEDAAATWMRCPATTARH